MTKVWLKVSFSCDCVGMNQDECSICGEEYTECPCPGAAPETLSMLALFPHRDKHWSTDCQCILRMSEYAGVAPSSGSMLALLPPKDKNWNRCLLSILCMLEWEREARAAPKTGSMLLPPSKY